MAINGGARPAQIAGCSRCNPGLQTSSVNMALMANVHSVSAAAFPSSSPSLFHAQGHVTGAEAVLGGPTLGWRSSTSSPTCRCRRVVGRCMRFMHSSNNGHAAVATLVSGMRVGHCANPKHLLVVPLKLRSSSFGAVPLRF